MSETAALPQPPFFGLPRRLLAEGLGTALLLSIIVGSGIMAERLAGGNNAVALLTNTMATSAGLVVLLTILGPISGAHLNPAISIMFAVRRDLSVPVAVGYVAAQLAGAVIGVWVAHLMFGEPLIQVSLKLRSGPAQAFSEGIATFGLVATILGGLRFRPMAVPGLVGLYIAAAYWFTASTSFANPAVTLARALSNSFAGIAPSSVPTFIAAQAVGTIIASLVFSWLFQME